MGEVRPQLSNARNT